MVVDDNVDGANSLAALLEAFGHNVVVMNDAQDALKTASAIAPDVFILDIGLPESDGYELAKRLRGQSDFAKATLIALTGYGQPNDKTLVTAAGFDHHFVKPVHI